MRNELQKFHETVDILVKAYMNDTLCHRMCTACAVGNIVAHHLGGLKQVEDKTNSISGIQPWYWEGDVRSDWYEAVESYRSGMYAGKNARIGYEQIEKTEYTIEEVDAIERAFESVSCPTTHYHLWGKDDAFMLRGLMAVVDVLAEIHNVDLEVKEAAKLMFV